MHAQYNEMARRAQNIPCLAAIFGRQILCCVLRSIYISLFVSPHPTHNHSLHFSLAAHPAELAAVIKDTLDQFAAGTCYVRQLFDARTNQCIGAVMVPDLSPTRPLYFPDPKEDALLFGRVTNHKASISAADECQLADSLFYNITLPVCYVSCTPPFHVVDMNMEVCFVFFFFTALYHSLSSHSHIMSDDCIHYGH